MFTTSLHTYIPRLCILTLLSLAPPLHAAELPDDPEVLASLLAKPLISDDAVVQHPLFDTFLKESLQAPSVLPCKGMPTCLQGLDGDGEAIAVVERLAYGADAPIPPALLAEMLRTPVTLLGNHLAIRQLLGNGMLQASEDHYTLSCPFEEVREWVGQRKGEVMENMVEVIVAVWCYDPHRGATWKPTDMLAPHLQALWAHTQDNKELGSRLLPYINDLGSHLSKYSDREDGAIALLQTAILQGKQWGADPSTQAWSHAYLGEALRTKGDIVLCKQTLAQGFQVWQEVGTKEESPVVGKMHDTLGSCYYNEGDYASAKECYNRALENRCATLEDDHPDTATTHNNLGMVHGALGQTSEALEHQLEAVRICTKTLGPDHIETAASYGNAGSSYLKQRNHELAESYFEKALTVNIKNLGEQHPNTAICYANIGNLYLTKNMCSPAIKHYEKSIAIAKAALGPNDLQVAFMENNLGTAHYRRGDRALALQHYRNAATIYAAAGQEGHPRAANNSSHLARIYYDEGNYTQSVVYRGKAYNVLHNKLGADHPRTIEAKRSLDAVQRCLEKAANLR